MRRTAAPYSKIVGAADGSIMAVIMTAHIAHSRNRCGASQLVVIIQRPAPVIGPYMSRAMTTIQVQQTTRTANSGMATASRSDWSAASISVGGRSAVDARPIALQINLSQLLCAHRVQSAIVAAAIRS